MTDLHTATGVLLLNLGGPEKPDDIRPFLFNIFSDRQIIRLGPAFLQPFIAWLIARGRAPKSAANYARIGGGSPILALTRAQARALEARLAAHGRYLVRPCMRYWHPCAEEAISELRAAGVQRLVALPLYPQYCSASTGSSLLALERALQDGPTLPLTVIRAWPDQPEYVSALARRVQEGLASFAALGGKTRLLYSAHNLPKRLVDEGDPYVGDLGKTIAALEQQTGQRGELCFQSRSGPVAWFSPSTPEAIEKAAAEGVNNLLLLPISFVSDHVETLVELDMEYRKLAEGLGMRYTLARALNDDPLFIEALARLVLAAETA